MKSDPRWKLESQGTTCLHPGRDTEDNGVYGSYPEISIVSSRTPTGGTLSQGNENSQVPVSERRRRRKKKNVKENEIKKSVSFFTSRPIGSVVEVRESEGDWDDTFKESGSPCVLNVVIDQ